MIRTQYAFIWCKERILENTENTTQHTHVDEKNIACTTYMT